MGQGKSTFKQADLTRALRAVVKAGRDVVRAEIARDGRIVLVSRTERRCSSNKTSGTNDAHQVEIRQRLREPRS